MKKVRKKKRTARSNVSDKKKVTSPKKKGARKAKHKEGEKKKMFGKAYVFRSGKFVTTSKADQGDYDSVKTEKGTPDRKRTQARARKQKQRKREQRVKEVLEDAGSDNFMQNSFII